MFGKQIIRVSVSGQTYKVSGIVGQTVTIKRNDGRQTTRPCLCEHDLADLLLSLRQAERQEMLDREAA